MESQLQYDAGLLRVLRALHFPLNDEQRQALRANVNAYVDLAKQQEWPPERIIATVKRTAHVAGLDASIRVQRSAAQYELITADPLLVEIVGWCIDRYFNAAE